MHSSGLVKGAAGTPWKDCSPLRDAPSGRDSSRDCATDDKSRESSGRRPSRARVPHEARLPASSPGLHIVRNVASAPSSEVSGTLLSGSSIPLREREARNAHKACVLWFTGYSGAGKSTLATALQRRLFNAGAQTVLLDGDEVRRDLGYSADDRTENIRRVAEVASLFYQAGNVVLCAFISPFARDRAFARSLIPEGRFLEIYVRCPLAVCEERDPHGLYGKALRGEIPEFTGLSSPYEPPQHPELVADTEADSVETIVAAILVRLAGLLRPAAEGERRPPE